MIIVIKQDPIGDRRLDGDKKYPSNGDKGMVVKQINKGKQNQYHWSFHQWHYCGSPNPSKQKPRQ